jgi:uncharacterized protein YwgA
VEEHSSPGSPLPRLRLLKPRPKETDTVRRDWLLLLLDSGLDPIRIQKAMFLFAQESGAPDEDRYGFRPYNWGPFSQLIYSDLEALQQRGLVERVPKPGTTYALYQRTGDGDATATRLRSQADQGLIAGLDDVKETVSRLSFEGLLRYVYTKYPEYAVNSVFQR